MSQVYVATVLFPQHKEAWAVPGVTEHKLRYNGRVVVRRSGTRPSRAFATESLRGGTLIAALLLKRHNPFSLTALMSPGEADPPLGYNVFVDPRIFSLQMERAYTVTGEFEISQLFRKFRVACFPGGHMGSAEEESAGRISKRRRLNPFHLERTLEWMMDMEANQVVSVPCFIDIPDTDYIFCVRDSAFQLRTTMFSTDAEARGALLVGARNAGKTHIVASLLRCAPPPRPVALVSTLVHRAPLSLCVVPEPLVAQWCAALDVVDARYVVVVDKTSWHARMTRDRLEETSVVVTSHSFLFSQVQLMTATMNRFQSRAVLQGSHSTDPLRFEWVHWQRVIVDELEALYVDHARVWPRLLDCLRADMWWGVQGGVQSHQVLRTLNLMDSVMPAASLASPRVFDLMSSRTLFLKPLFAHHLSVLPTRVSVTLPPLERAVYAVLKTAGTSLADLSRVCAGDISPMRRFVTPVSSWADAVPLGIQAIDECFQYMQDEEEDEEYEEEWEEVEEEEEEEVAPPQPAELPSLTAVDEAAVDEEHMDEEHMDEEHKDEEEASNSSEDALPLRRVVRPLDDTDEHRQARAAAAAYEEDVEAQFNDAFSSAMRDMHEKRVFFQKVAHDLASGKMEAPTCVVCMSSPSDCLFVCGHMLCHTCSVNVFVTAARADSVTINDRTNLIAPCPTCRWNAEPHEIFWTCGVSPSALVRRGGKLDALLSLCKEVAGGTVVFGDHPSVLAHMREQLTGLGVPARIMSGSVRHCQNTLQWAKHAASHVLLVPCATAAGLKFSHNVSRVIFLQPVPPATQAACMQCLTANRALELFALVASDTHESE